MSTRRAIFSWFTIDFAPAVIRVPVETVKDGAYFFPALGGGGAFIFILSFSFFLYPSERSAPHRGARVEPSASRRRAKALQTVIYIMPPRIIAGLLRAGCMCTEELYDESTCD